MSEALEKYLRGELDEGKIALPEMLTPDILKSWRDAPTTLRIETTNHCNGKCMFCAHPKMKRKKGYMTQTLFKKIVDQCVDLHPKIVKPFGHGELFVDPRWKKRLTYLDKKLNSKIHIETNGSMLDNDAVEFITDLNHIDTISFNFPSPDPVKYEELMGLGYDDAKTNILRTVDICKAKKKYINIYVVMVTSATYQTVTEGMQFRQIWGPIGHTRMHFNYGGVIGPKGVTHRYYCTGLSEMCILWDGKVSLCWMDIEGKEIIGNAKKEDLLDVWNSDKVIDIRKQHRDGDRSGLELCNRCDFC